MKTTSALREEASAIWCWCDCAAAVVAISRVFPTVCNSPKRALCTLQAPLVPASCAVAIKLRMCLKHLTAKDDCGEQAEAEGFERIAGGQCDY